MKLDKNRLFILTLLTVVLAIVVARFDFDIFDFSSQNVEKREAIAKLNRVLKVVDRYYVDTLDWNEASTGAIEGLLKKLDPHSVYFTPIAVEQNEENFNGRYYGIGIQFDVIDEFINVISVIPGSPSEKAGILAGDKIIQIDGESAKNISTAEVPKKLKGPEDTEVTITIERTFLKPFDITLVRAEIPIFTINTYFKPNDTTGYIWVNRFANTTVNEFEEALKDLEKQGIERLILDLRGNGGGYLRQAVQVVGKFISGHKKVVYTKGRSNSNEEVYYTDDFGVNGIRDYPLVVLIDHSSASASEIVSGALQDYDRALIVGETSFGKGLVQNEFELDDHSRIRLTVSKYYTPSGRLIQRPYKNKNIEDYYLEGVSDSVIAETDTLKERPVFTTAGGRKVFGGGGITPDVEVPFESYSKSRAMTTQFYQKRVFFETAAQFVSQNPGWKKSSKKFLQSFTVSTKLLNQFKEIARQKEINFTTAEFNLDLIYLKNRLKAEIARNIWGSATMYRVLLEYDNQFEKALNLSPEATQYLSETGQK